MVESNQHDSDKSAVKTDDFADLSSVQNAWERVWEAQKDQFKKTKILVEAEMMLSLKSIFLSLMCVLVMVGLGLIIWISTLLTIGYALLNAGFHWFFIAAAMILINVMMFWVVSRIFQKACGSIGLTKTIDTVFNTHSSDSSEQTR